MTQKNKVKWTKTRAGNFITKGQDENIEFTISYRPIADELCKQIDHIGELIGVIIGIDVPHSEEETALITENPKYYFVLEGDHRYGYAERINSIKECLKYFIKTKKQDNHPWSIENLDEKASMWINKQLND